MKTYYKVAFLALVLSVSSCNKIDDFIGGGGDDDTPDTPDPTNTNVNFQFAHTIDVGGEASAEITAFDPNTNKIFVVNNDDELGLNEITVYDITNINAPVQENSIDVSTIGAPNSVAVANGLLAVAVEAPNKQALGSVLVYDTATQVLQSSYTVGALPDMVTFTPDGTTILSANEGEPNEEYTVDPNGSVSIIDVASGTVTTLEFDGLSHFQENLEKNGFRIFGPNATFASDIEPEFITVSEDSKTAYVALQENNGLAVVDLETNTITEIWPLGYQDYSLPGNEIDPSDRDDIKELRNVPALGIFQPDGITSATINGVEYIVTANEGDARDYDAFSEEERADDLLLDATIFPNAMDLQMDANLGRLEVTTVNGDTDGDGDFDQIVSFGGRSFTIWDETGNRVYDSGNEIGSRTLALTPDRFNDNDGRSDAKGAEPESVAILNLNDERYILFVGLERNDQVLVYDMTNPAAPEFIQLLANANDEAPEGLLVIPASDSPSGKDLLLVSNEDSGTVTIYENK
ncbi:choice-of-anchor I family protein [Spongiimicrobium salis]|uniref:choice-of-anchor I family protein n=1 Tax=Spongiimicrobium salis TaxID=1667022 RepID=UPI00374CD28D